MSRWIIGVILIVSTVALTGCGRAPRSDPALVDLAVRATVFSIPTPTPRIVEVTRVIEVTRIVEVTRVVEATPAPTATATAAPAAQAAPAAPVAIEAAAAPAEVVAEVAIEAPAAAAEPEQSAARRAPSGCPTASERSFTLIPITGGVAEHPDGEHGDLNLALRGYIATSAEMMIVDINGPTDSDPPQLAGIFSDGRTPAFLGGYQVRGWNWGCSARGCAGEPLDQRPVTLLGLGVQPGEALSIPSRGAEIYGGGFKALVLYADEQRITLNYTREDSVANGYAIHLEQICVDPNLLALYRQANGAGRGNLPAIRNGEVVGTALSGELAVAVRDRGVFFDPRSRKDWWRGR